MIEASGLNRFFGPTHAVKDLSFRVEPGEIVGFLGPNGAGKTTTMRMLTGTLRPSEGSVHICGHDMATAPLQAKGSIGYLPEVPPIDPAMVVEDYLTFAAALHGMPNGERPAAVARAVQKTSLQPVQKRLIGALSKGYRQRVGIAQALVHDPPVVILDEPAGGLDPEQIQELRKVIRDLRGDHTVLLSTHIMQEVAAVCDRAMIIDNGRLLASDSLDSLARTVRARRQILARVESIPDTLPAWTRAGGCRRPASSSDHRE